MTLLQWKPSFSLGIPAVDLEHREMISAINDVYGKLQAQSPAPAAIDAVLGEIHAGISAHFALEEAIMRRANYDEYAAHKEDHEALLDQIRDLMDIFSDDPQRGGEELERRLSDWFGEHFSSYDARLHHALNG